MSHIGLYVGCDPGAEAGIVVLDAGGGLVESLRLDHDDGSGALAFLEPRRDRIVMFGLEHARPYRGNGVVGAFRLGERFSQIRMACMCLRIPTMLIDAKAWQESAGFAKPSRVSVADLDPAKYATSDEANAASMRDKAARAAAAKTRDRLKRAITEHARLRWPALKLKVKDELADAAFLADHARRFHLGEKLERPKRAAVKAEAV